MLERNTVVRRAPTEVYWGEAAPIEHSVQIYSDDSLFMDALEGYTSGGLRLGENVIVIATKSHRGALERRLRVRGYNVTEAQAEDRYIPVDAEAVLSLFMVDGQPDENLFNQVIDGFFTRASANGQRVRVYLPVGELLPGISYLIRRLMENTSNTSFLRQTYAEKKAVESLIKTPAGSIPRVVDEIRERQGFHNEALINFSKRENRQRFAAILREVRGFMGDEPPHDDMTLLVIRA